MKSSQGLVLSMCLFVVLLFFMNAWSLFHMAGLYDRIHELEKAPVLTKPSPELKSFTAEEADEWLQYSEDTPENRRKWAEAGTPMRFAK